MGKEIREGRGGTESDKQEWMSALMTWKRLAGTGLIIIVYCGRRRDWHVDTEEREHSFSRDIRGVVVPLYIQVIRNLGSVARHSRDKRSLPAQIIVTFVASTAISWCQYLELSVGTPSVP